MRTVKLSPSIICANPLSLSEDLRLLDQGDAEFLHFDVMDGHYVPYFGLGPDLCRSLAEATTLPLDIHLMIENADQHLHLFTGFPNAFVSIHPETVYHPVRTLQAIASLGATPGICLSPSIVLEQAKPLLPYVGMVCVMTVSPGFVGQKLIPEMLDKITALREYRDKMGLAFEIEVDGNVSWENIPRMVKAGAEVLIAGTSSIFGKGKDLLEGMRRMREVAAEAAK